MRYALILAFLPLPALAWDFTPDPICTLYHDEAASSVRVTYDPEWREYEFSIALNGGTWAPSASFGITFSGALPMTIGTTQHRISKDRMSLSVSDSGFDNVLNGLEQNHTATAFTPAQSVPFRTRDIVIPMEKFRACLKAAPATS